MKVESIELHKKEIIELLKKGCGKEVSGTDYCGKKTLDGSYFYCPRCSSKMKGCSEE